MDAYTGHRGFVGGLGSRVGGSELGYRIYGLVLQYPLLSLEKVQPIFSARLCVGMFPQVSIGHRAFYTIKPLGRC